MMKKRVVQRKVQEEEGLKESVLTVGSLDTVNLIAPINQVFS